MDQQLNLFNYGLERKQITKKTRLIELFSGIGAQAKALEIMGVDFEHYKTCEWASPSIKAYNAIHIKDFTDYSANLSKEELIAYLDGNISNNYSEPCNVRKQTETWLRETYNSCIATHNLMNIMKVKGEDLEIKDTDKYEYIMTYSFPCVIAGTKIKTENGYKNIEDITLKDKVLTHTGTYQKVLKTMKRESDHYYIIKGVGCQLYLTEEHPLYVLRDNKIQWVKVKDLKKTDKLSYNINKKSVKSDYSQEILWLLGRYVADGYIGNYNSVCFAIGDKKAKIFEEMTPHFNRKTCHKKGCYEYRIANKELQQLCLEFQKGAVHKHIPQWVIDLPRDQLNDFFNGYMSGDGHIRERAMTTQLMCSTVSKELYLGLQDIMIKLFNACPSLYIRKDKRKETFNDSYNLQLSLHYRNIWQEKIDNHIFVKISSIERVNERTTVYNIEVEQDNSYTCDNVIVHNCQDLSLAGTRGGMSVSQSEGGTRSGLLWEVERILTELFEKEKELPQILLCENVPEIMSEQSLPDLQKWVKRLEEFGYTSHYAILNSKEFNVPQNRKRFFMVSILGEYAYEFPIKMKLKYKLKDFLEKETEEKYYLTEQAIERISKWKSQQDPLKDIDKEKIICPTVLASNSHGEHGGMVLINENLFEDNEIIDYSSSADFMRNHSNKVVPTIVCHDKFGVVEKIPIKNATKEGYVMAEDGDGIDISSRMEYHRGTVQKGLSQTLTCSGGNNVGVVVPEQQFKRFENYITWQDKQGNFNTQCNRASLENDICLTVPANNTPKVALTNTHKLRIRKLTPRECIRLMGFEDKDTDSMYQIGLGDTKIWHCAGDSIVVPVLIAILSPLYFSDTKHIEIINNYLGEKYEN